MYYSVQYGGTLTLPTQLLPVFEVTDTSIICIRYILILIYRLGLVYNFPLLPNFPSEPVTSIPTSNSHNQESEIKLSCKTCGYDTR